jgi:hypothetical protein
MGATLVGKSTVTLEGVEIKLDRARSHANTFLTEEREFMRRERNNYRFSTEIHDEGRRHIYRLVEQPMLPPHWPAVFGDFVHNLRSALDHLAWQLVKLNRGSPNESTQFPIWPNEFRYVDGAQKALWVSGGVSPAALGEIKAVQPYQRPDRLDFDFLWRLRNLDVIDKHRHLTFHAAAVRGVARTAGPHDESPDFSFRWKAFRNGEIVLVATYPRPQHEPDLSLNPAILVVLAEGAPKHMVGEQVIVAVVNLYCHVQLVIDRFRPMFGLPRLGPHGDDDESIRAYERHLRF